MAVGAVEAAAAPGTVAPGGSSAASRAGALLQAWRGAGQERQLRAPHPAEPARPVLHRPAHRHCPQPGLATCDSCSAPRGDDYDRRVKQAAGEKARRQHRPVPTRPREPDLQV